MGPVGYMAKLSSETQEKIKALKDHYPQRRSAVMPALQYAQKELGLIEEDTMNEVAELLEKKLGIKSGETTPDGKFTIMEVECLGACGWAPMMMVGDSYYEFLDAKKTDAIVEALVEGKEPPGGPHGKEQFR